MFILEGFQYSADKNPCAALSGFSIDPVWRREVSLSLNNLFSDPVKSELVKRRKY